MRNVLFSILFLLTPLLCSTFSFAGNEHEHLQYLPRYEDIQKAMDGKLGNVSAREVLGNNPFTIYRLFGEKATAALLPSDVPLMVNGKLNMEPARLSLMKLLNEVSFGELCKRIADNTHHHPEKVMQSFFELNPFQVDTFEGYMKSGVIRTSFFEMHPDAFQRSIQNYLDHAPKSETLKTLFTIPDFMLNPQLLKPIKKMYEVKGLQTQFFMTLPRGFLSKPGDFVADEITKFSEVLKNGWADGIDLSGSIREGEAVVKNADKIKIVTQERLKKVLILTQKYKAPLRIHSFESGNTGPFYDALWATLEECKIEKCLPSVLRIGHIQELRPEDIQKLSKLKVVMPIVFEANIESNLKVQSSEIKKLSNTIEHLHQNGFRVVLGADGRGILGESSAFESTLAQLKDAGMSESSLKTLIKDAHLPIRNTRIDKKQLLEWQKERLAVQNRILGAPMHSSGSCSADFMEILRRSFKNAR